MRKKKQQQQQKLFFGTYDPIIFRNRKRVTSRSVIKSKLKLYSFIFLKNMKEDYLILKFLVYLTSQHIQRKERMDGVSRKIKINFNKLILKKNKA